MDPVEIMKWGGAVVVVALALFAVAILFFFVKSMTGSDEEEPEQPESGVRQIDLGGKS